MAEGQPLVRVERRPGVAVLTLDSPHNRNALSRALLEWLHAGLVAAGKDPEVRVVVLTGAGPVFCSGADLKEPRRRQPTSRRAARHPHPSPGGPAARRRQGQPRRRAGYWGMPEATAEACRGGWFHTGDLGRMDDQGYIALVDRKKDMITSGGENVYPIEVEQVLYRHEAVQEVAVVGVPDERWGETPVAVVAPAPGVELVPEELIGYARERLAHFKCPTRVEVVDALPRNATGKVLKTELRARYGGTSSAVSG